MEVYEKINQILVSRSMSKRDFSTKLRSIEPKLKSTGEVPTEKAIYGYLNGTSNLKIELIPYIAEVLNIKEQVLFESTIYKVENNNTSSVQESKVVYENKQNHEFQKLIDLLPYAPNSLLKKMIEKLEGIKKISDLD